MKSLPAIDSLRAARRPGYSAARTGTSRRSPPRLDHFASLVAVRLPGIYLYVGFVGTTRDAKSGNPARKSPADHPNLRSGR